MAPKPITHGSPESRSEGRFRTPQGGFLGWWRRTGGEWLVLSLFGGWFVQWWFGPYGEFSPLLFILGVLSTWGIASAFTAFRDRKTNTKTPPTREG